MMRMSKYLRDKEWDKDNDFKLSKPLIWPDSLQMRIYKNMRFTRLSPKTLYVRAWVYQHSHEALAHCLGNSALPYFYRYCRLVDRELNH